MFNPRLEINNQIIIDPKFYNHIKLPYFIHRVYIECAIELWNNPYLLYHDYPPIEIKRNHRDCILLIKDCIKETIRKLLPMPIYNDVEGQPFLRLYAKFSKKSIPIMKEYVKGYIIVPGPLQKIIPMDPDNGVYMIAYSDNNNAITLKNHLKNTLENRELYEILLEKSLGIPTDSLHIIALKDYYWPIGTHYYKPLNKELYRSRDEFIDKAQHPEKGILVVGEAISINQGWTEGALESVKAVLTKKWIETIC